MTKTVVDALEAFPPENLDIRCEGDDVVFVVLFGGKNVAIAKRQASSGSMTTSLPVQSFNSEFSDLPDQRKVYFRSAGDELKAQSRFMKDEPFAVVSQSLCERLESFRLKAVEAHNVRTEAALKTNEVLLPMIAELHAQVSHPKNLSADGRGH